MNTTTSFHTTSYWPMGPAATSSMPQLLTPALAAMVPNPLGQRLRIRQRLGPQVYVADCVHELPVRGSATTVPIKQRVIKLERLQRACGSRAGWQELRVARQLHARGGHRHIVRIVETHVAHDMGFVVMEHCTGGDLFGHLLQSPTERLSQQEALAKLHQIACGVQFLHQHNIAHRDLSLENILLQNGECKICDFGLSARADIFTNDVVGKTQYAAPEVVQGDWYDPVRADLWSLGVILFMLLTGSPLVQFASPVCPEFNAFRVVGVHGILQAWGMESLLSTETIHLLSRLLEVNPEHRLSSITELLEHPAMEH